jgi:Fe-S-cluster containining protein
VDESRVYFTWPDRRFSYECRGCGACCKGHGIGIDVAGGQLVQLLARRPGLTAFLRRRGDAITAFNPRDRCWFLADDGLCRIEVEDGRAAKPASCRLFPFNRVFRIGSYTVVDYNSVICPLHVADSGITHREVLDEIASVQDANIVGTQLPARNADEEGRAFVDGERAIATAVFAAAALDLPTSPSSDDPATAMLAAAWSAQADEPALDRECEHARSAFATIVGSTWRVPSIATLGNACWLTPSMRFNELFGPRQYAPRSAMSPVLARMWLAWLGFAAEGEALAGRPLDLQELTTLWSEQAPLMHAVARWSEMPSLKPGPMELPGIDPGGLVKKLGQAFVENRKAKQTFGALVEKCGGDPATRVTALKLADALMRAGFAR